MPRRSCDFCRGLGTGDGAYGIEWMETQKPRRVASLQPSVNEIGEICYRALGRGDAVGAMR